MHRDGHSVRQTGSPPRPGRSTPSDVAAGGTGTGQTELPGITCSLCWKQPAPAFGKITPKTPQFSIAKTFQKASFTRPRGGPGKPSDQGQLVGDQHGWKRQGLLAPKCFYPRSGRDPQAMLRVQPPQTLRGMRTSWEARYHSVRPVSGFPLFFLNRTLWVSGSGPTYTPTMCRPVGGHEPATLVVGGLCTGLPQCPSGASPRRWRGTAPQILCCPGAWALLSPEPLTRALPRRLDFPG